MLAKRPPPPPFTYVLRTAGARTEYKGAHVEGLELLFVALPDALARRKMLDRLEKQHAKMLAREAGPDVEQQTTAQVATLASQVHPNSALPPVPYCRVCQGHGAVSTGIDESPTTLCGDCGGTGFQP
jgi:DnaJ-class molecular chaperone